MTNEQALAYFKRRKEQFGLSDMTQRAEDCAIKALERALEWERGIMIENRGVCCGEIIPEETMVCSICSKSNENLVTPEFICGQLAECFDIPCTMSPFEEELHDTEEKDEWCEKFCGKATAADCWMRYFQLKYNEKENTK